MKTALLAVVLAFAVKNAVAQTAPASVPAIAPALTAATGQAADFPDADKAKLVSLFDGKTTTGWIQQPRSATTLGGGNITDSFTAKLTEHTDPVSGFLYDHLDDLGKAALEKPATQPAAADLKKTKADLVKSLNAIITGPSIYDQTRFSGIKLREETQSLLASNPTDYDLSRLNRALLEDAMPDILKPSPFTAWSVKDDALASTGAGRGTLYTADDYSSYRILFDIRHVGSEPKKDHQACVLVFCTQPAAGDKGMDALGGVQFQVPNGGHWDYRKGFNNGGKNFTNILKPKFNNHEWARCEIIVDAKTGSARMAVAQPIGTKAVEVLDFKDAAIANHPGPFALQMHNDGLYDEYKNIQVETDPATNDLLTTK